MIEVFKTNVEDPNEAAWLVSHLGKIFPDYVINFDLEDCDRILRVKCEARPIDSANIILLLQTSGFAAELLEGDITLDLTTRTV